MSRVNWTQTTTVTIAAFIGCLAAVAVLVLLMQTLLGKAIRERMAKLDQLDTLIDASTDELTELNRRKEVARKDDGKRKPVTQAPKPEVKEPEPEAKNDDDTPKGEPISTTPTV